MICHVNLIPINKIENGKFDKSSNENILKFRDYLNDHGIVATVRRELGSDMMQHVDSLGERICDPL